MTRTPREYNGDIIHFLPRPVCIIAFANELHVARDLLFCKLIRVCGIAVPPDRPRRNGIEAIEPDVDETRVPVRVARRGSPMRRN